MILFKIFKDRGKEQMRGTGNVLAAEENLRWAVCTVYLLICAFQDIRRRKIGIRPSVFAGCAAMIMDGALVLSGNAGVLVCLGGLLPGIMLLLLAYLSGGAAGCGDGICFLVLGALLWSRMTWILLMCALMLAAVCGAFLMLFRHAGRKTRMPFLAFTAAAWAGMLTVCLSGINW